MKKITTNPETGEQMTVEMTETEMAELRALTADEPALADVSQISALWQKLPIDVQAMFAPYRVPFAQELEAGNYAVARRMIELQITKLPAGAAHLADEILAKIPTP